MTMTPLDRLVQIHKAIAHPIRLRLLAALRAGPLCVCQMTAVVNLAASTVSEHLSELRKAGLIAARKEGRWVEYRLSDSSGRGGILETIWPAMIDDCDAQADAVLLKELRRVPLDDLCSAGLDLARLDRPRLTSTLAKVQRMRARAEVTK